MIGWQVYLPDSLGAPKVDVVLATNRCSVFLVAALASVRAQTYTKWHLTLVDDGVPDANFLSKALVGTGPSTLVRQTHGGVSRARNHGFNTGTAPLVCFLDDDDTWKPQRLSILVELLVKNPEAVGAFSGGEYIDESGTPWGQAWPGERASSLEMLAGEKLLPRLPTLLFRRDAIQSVGGFDEALRVAEDNDLILRILQLGQLVGIDVPLVDYRRYGGNTSAAGTLEARVISRTILLRQAATAEEDDRPNHAVALRANLTRLKRHWAVESMRAFRSAVQELQFTAAAREIRWSASVHPVASLRRLCCLALRSLRAWRT